MVSFRLLLLPMFLSVSKNFTKKSPKDKQAKLPFMCRKIWIKRMERLMLMFAALGFSTQQFLPETVGLIFYGLGFLCFVLWLFFLLKKPPPQKY